MAESLLLCYWQFCYTNSFSGASFYTVDYLCIPEVYLGCSHSFKLPTEKVFIPFVLPFLAEYPQQKMYCCFSDEGEVQSVFPVSAFSVITQGWIRVQWVLQIGVIHRAVFYLCSFPLETIARNSWFHELFCKWHTSVGLFADVFLIL